MEILEILWNQMSLFSVGLWGWMVFFSAVMIISFAIEKIVKLIGKQIAKIRRPAEAQEMK